MVYVEYPKALYGPRGWDDLDDCMTVHDEVEEIEARDAGYKTLPEIAGSETVADPVDWSGKWLSVCADLKSRGFNGGTKHEAIAWAKSRGLNVPERKL